MRDLMKIVEEGGRPDLGAVVAEAKSEATKALSHHLGGSFLAFTVKIRPFKGSRQHWMALYRGASQFGASGPIFWIKDSLIDDAAREGVDPSDLVRVVRDSILHEYGHVIAEWADRHLPDLAGAIRSKFPDEEDFAEGFAMTLGDGDYDPIIAEIAQRYAEGLRAMHTPVTLKSKPTKRASIDPSRRAELEELGRVAGSRDKDGSSRRDDAAREAGFEPFSAEGIAFGHGYDAAFWS